VAKCSIGAFFPLSNASKVRSRQQRINRQSSIHSAAVERKGYINYFLQVEGKDVMATKGRFNRFNGSFFQKENRK